jgi:hypothetical protein
MLALANSGGGYVLIAFRKAQARCVPSLERPEWLDGYSQDTVNDILRGRPFSDRALRVLRLDVLRQRMLQQPDAESREVGRASSSDSSTTCATRRAANSLGRPSADLGIAAVTPQQTFGLRWQLSGLAR